VPGPQRPRLLLPPSRGRGCKKKIRDNHSFSKKEKSFAGSFARLSSLASSKLSAPVVRTIAATRRYDFPEGQDRVSRFLMGKLRLLYIGRVAHADVPFVALKCWQCCQRYLCLALILTNSLNASSDVGCSGKRAMSKRALFLDRDGVINVDRGYVHRPDQFEFVPGIFELGRFWTNEVRGPIVVVTNQSGIGRGYFDENAYTELTRWMCDRFAEQGTIISRVYHCPYHPLEGIGEYRCNHPWRKPNPGMLLQAIVDLRLDPSLCAIVGDKSSDMEAGAAAGIGVRVLLGSER
jgi:D-glycero-D-manno-heptose 1,7-bisphosphate phosphatase